MTTYGRGDGDYNVHHCHGTTILTEALVAKPKAKANPVAIR